jgi:hypothetical protein
MHVCLGGELFLSQCGAQTSAAKVGSKTGERLGELGGWRRLQARIV